MKVTYSNSYDRSEGYVVSMTVDAQNISIEMFYEEGAIPKDMAATPSVDGETINAAWAGKKLVPYSTLSLSLDEVKAAPSWADRSVWTGSGRFLPDIMLPTVKQTKLWHNITAETYNSKVRPIGHFLRQLRTTPMDLGAFLMYVPFKDSTFDDCALHILSMVDGIPHLVNGVPLTDPQTDPQQAQLSAMPRLQLTGPATIPAGDYALMDILLTDANDVLVQKDVEVYLEAVSGYLPKTRVTLMKGKGVAKVMALGLDAGDTVRVKAGFKFWTNDTDHTLEVQ